MDRLFLDGLVRELGPSLISSRVRDVGLLADGCYLTLDAPGARASQLAIGLRADAPSMALFPRPDALSGSGPASSFRSRLRGFTLAELELNDSDRILRLQLRKRRASGRSEELTMIIEWVGPRSAAYVVDTERIVDYVSPTRARQTRGETYTPPDPPPGSRSLIPTPDLDSLTRELGEPGQWDERRLRRAGFAPLLAREIVFRVGVGVNAGRVLEALNEELALAEARLWLRKQRAPSSSRTPIHRVSTFELAHAAREFDSVPVDGFNDAIRRGLAVTDRFRRARASYLLLSRVLNKERERLERLQQKLLAELDETKDAPRLRRYGELLLAGHERATQLPVDASGVQEVELDNTYVEGETIRVPIDPRFGLIANAERYYKRASKQQKRHSKLETRLVDLGHELDFVDTLRWSLDELGGEPVDRAGLEQDLERLRAELSVRPRLARGIGIVERTDGKRSGKKKMHPQGVAARRFRTSSGKRVFAGKSSKSNAEVSFRLAAPEDPWFHVLGMPGAHVVLKLESGDEPTPEDIQEAAALAGYFSRARSSSYVEVMVSRARSVSKIRGAPPGTVRVAEYRSMRVAPALLESDEGEEP